MKVTNNNWRIASRDLFHSSCEHCMLLSMAVAAGSQWAIDAKTGFEEPKEKLIFFQGAEYEDIRFADLKESLPEGDFIELPSFATKDQTQALLDQKVPVIAQAYLELDYGHSLLTGYADLLVREDYEVEFHEGKLIAKQVRSEGNNYTPYDIKHSDKPKDIYWLQLGTYQEALEALGLSTNRPLGIIGVSKITYQEANLALSNLKVNRQPLFDLLANTSPEQARAWQDLDLHCPEPATCANIYCEYPKLCDADRIKHDLFTQLYYNGKKPAKHLAEQGVDTVAKLAALSENDSFTGVDQASLKELIEEAQLIENEKFNREPKYLKKTTASKTLPEPSPGDLFFDLEWFTPVLSPRINYIFGSVDHDGKFFPITANSLEEERQAFQDFVSLVLDRIQAHPDLHVYHWDNPESLGMKYLVEKHGIQSKEVEEILKHFVDLKPIAKDLVKVGIGGYSLKQLEHYYQDTSGRETTTKDGADSLLQYYYFLQTKAQGNTEEAARILKDIHDYNEADCISTRDAYNWLRSL